jgi:cyclic-di-GMP phosphodiesterase TipF (flagellum assembly factor)
MSETELLGDIHPEDLKELLRRNGLSLIAERIEDERTVIDLLDFDIDYGQGYLFSRPRPVRRDMIAA